ncbi:biotinidase [Rhinophrynus dorsalis]
MSRFAADTALAGTSKTLWNSSTNYVKLATMGFPVSHKGLAQASALPDNIEITKPTLLCSFGKACGGLPKMLPASFKFVICIFCCQFFSLQTYGIEYYMAAVYEHHAILNPNSAALSDRKSAFEFMSKNLDIYEEQVTAAAKKGAQIIVFPEDGIHGFNYTRQSIYPYLDFIPPSHLLPWNPCLEPHRFSDTEVLQRLSCMAVKGRMFLVANLGTKVPCEPLTSQCPSDSRYQFNTNVVFSDNGTLVASYFKQNLYFEYAFDALSEPQYVVFDTPFSSKFALFTCFDILFKAPAVNLIEKHKVKHVLYPTAWMNQLPLLSAVQIQRGFSTAFNINFLAANIHHTTLGMTGSGIYTPTKSSYYYDMSNEQGRLIVDKVPVNPSDVLPMDQNDQNPEVNSVHTHSNLISLFHSGELCENDDGTDYCEGSVIRTQMPPSVFHAEMMYDNFTLILLTEKEGMVHVCAGTLCCYLSYSKDIVSDELYALGVFDGLHTVHGTYSLQICALIKCGGLDPNTCGHEVTDAKTVINFHLWGNFQTKHIFPTILTSGVSLHLPDFWGWKNYYCHMYKKEMSSGLLSAALYGRWYGRD